MATLDKLKDAIDDDKIAVVSGQRGTKDASFVERKGGRYCAVIAGQSVDGSDFDMLLKALRTSGHKAYDLAWSASWTTIDHKEAMSWIKRTLPEFMAACGLSSYTLSQQAKVDKAVIREIEQGHPVAEAKALRICKVLSDEFERPIQVTDVRGMKVC